MLHEEIREHTSGEILKEEFLDPMGISAYRLSKETFIPQTRISEVVKGRRRVTADTALCLSKFFGTTARFWLGLQDDYDLEEENSLKLTNAMRKIELWAIIDVAFYRKVSAIRQEGTEMNLFF